MRSRTRGAPPTQRQLDLLARWGFEPHEVPFTYARVFELIERVRSADDFAAALELEKAKAAAWL